MQRLPIKLLSGTPEARRRTFFVTVKTSQGKALLQSERMANLFIDVLRSFTPDSRFKINEFVVMRNFVQLLVTVNAATSVEEVVQRIKARFAVRATRELGIRDWIWERETASVPVRDCAGFLKYKSAIEENPLKAGMSESATAYPYCSAYLRKNKPTAKSVRPATEKKIGP